MPDQTIEVEAKFLVPDAATFASLQRIERLGSFELRPLGSQKVLDRYLDTADKHLYRAGLACRLRTINRRQLLTIKWLTPARDIIHRRQEVEMLVKSDRWTDWPDGEAKRLVLEATGSAPLDTFFVVYQARHRYHVLHQKQPVLEYSLDAVSLHRPGTVDYYELEVEIIQGGSQAHLNQFIHRLQAQWTLPPETKNKFERGLNRQKRIRS